MTTTPSQPPAPQPGRPRSLDDAKRREICALVSAGCSLAEAARYVRCALSTIHRERRANHKFREQLRQAHTEAQLQPLRAMRKAADTHWRAAAWMLERTQPDRFARRQHPAFGRQTLRALTAELHVIVDDERLSPSQCHCIKKRITDTLHGLLTPPHHAPFTRQPSPTIFSVTDPGILYGPIEHPPRKPPFLSAATPSAPANARIQVENPSPPQSQ